jgi:centromere protein C
VSAQQNDGEDDFAPIDEEVEPSIENLEQDFNAPMVDDEDDYDVGQSLPNEADPHDATGNMDATLMAATAESALARMRGQKRDRTSLQGVDDADRADSSMLVTDSQPPPQKRKRGRPRKSDTIVDVAAEVGAIGESQVASGDQSAMDNGEGPSTLNVDEEVIAEEPIVKRKRGRPPKGSKPKTPENPKSPTKAPKSIQSPSKSGARGASVGPVSNVHLRATTPFEDAQNNASRFGRNLIKPLKYWANESRIYRNGDIEGIVRAEPVEIVSKARARKSRKKGRKPAQKLEDIEEVSDTESILPDEWEDERGVLAFDLANYDPATGTGDIDDAIRQGMCSMLSIIQQP